METKKVNRTNIAEHLFDYQLSFIGKTRIDIVDQDRWWFYFTMTREQYRQFNEYAVSLMMKVLRIPKSKAKGQFEWYWSMFGVRLKG